MQIKIDGFRCGAEEDGETLSGILQVSIPERKISNLNIFVSMTSNSLSLKMPGRWVDNNVTVKKDWVPDVTFDDQDAFLAQIEKENEGYLIGHFYNTIVVQNKALDEEARAENEMEFTMKKQSGKCQK